LGQGRDAVCKLLQDNVELSDELEGRIKEAITGGNVAVAIG
jgi:hypothetical protein